jgi:hypothetical protein
MMLLRSSGSSSKGICVALGCIAALWLVATTPGALGNFDTELRLRMAHSWWSGEPEVDPNLPSPTSRYEIEYGVVGTSGERLVFYDPGQSLLMVPWDWLATQLSPHIKRLSPKDLSEVLLVWTLFLPINVAVVLSAFWLLVGLRIEPRLAALSTLLWLLGTTVLPYAQIPFQNNQVLLCVLLAHAALLQWVTTRRTYLLIVSGVATAASLLVRTTAAIHVVTIGLFVIVVLAATLSVNNDRLRALAVWLVGFVPLAIVDRVFDHVRYGGFLTTGQSIWSRTVNTDPVFAGLPQVPPGFPFTSAASDGILGVLFSPAKSVFLYDPLLLPCLLAIVFTWKHLALFVRWYVLLAVLDLLLHIGLTAKLQFWQGDWSWGARYHVTSVQLLVLPMLPQLVQAAMARGRGMAWLVRLCFVVALVMQALAVAMPYGVEVAAEDIETHPSCDENNYDLDRGFRLKDRVVNIYCLSESTRTGVCEDTPAIKEAAAKPLCGPAVRNLTRFRRLAFFPFHPEYAASFPLLSMIVWIGASLLAFTTTLFWCRELIRGSKPPPRINA